MIVIEQAARKAKVDADPIVKRRMALADDQILQDAYFNSILGKEISKHKLQAAYNQYAKDAPGREEINARHILMSSEADANDVIAQLKKGADFATLAKQKTIDPAGKTSGGDLGWFGQGDLDPAFTAAAFKLKKGEYTQAPVHTQYGWHVIMVVDRRPLKVLPYEQMAPRLAQQMAQGIIGQRVKELDTQAKVEIFALDGSKLPASGGAPGPAPKPSGAPKLTPPAPGPGAGGAGRAGAVARDRAEPDQQALSRTGFIPAADMTEVSPLAPKRFPDLPPRERGEVGDRALRHPVQGPHRSDGGAARSRDVRGRRLHPVADGRRPGGLVPPGAGGEGTARAIVVNSGNANVFTGKAGRQADGGDGQGDGQAPRLRSATRSMSSSTGVIGEPLPDEKITAALPGAVARARCRRLGRGRAGDHDHRHLPQGLATRTARDRRRARSPSTASPRARA